tara:strand:- start:1091 stop:2329 length:1239 start_codon:yes stop_codon:yes gene_type:complete
VPWFIYYALKQLFPTKKKISFFSLISILGVSLGVCILLIVQSVMNGFGENIRQRLTKTQGDITIRSVEGIEQWKDLRSSLETLSSVEGVLPFVENIAMIQSDSASAFPVVRGINIESQNSVLPITDFIIRGSLEDLDDDSVLLGISLADTIKAPIGSKIVLYSPALLNQLENDEIIFPTEFTVAGFITSGSPHIDRQLVLGTLSSFQELLDIDDRISGFNVKLKEGENLSEVQAQIIERTQSMGIPLSVLTWRDLNEDFLYVVEQEKAVISFIIIFILLVASFSIAVALTLSVMRRTREIGLLCSLGAQSWQIALCFCFQGIIIGLLGSILGTVLAYICLENRDALLGFYIGLTNADLAFLGVYDLYSIPVQYLKSDFINVFIISITVSFFAAIIPAIRAARLKPSNALRNE